MSGGCFSGSHLISKVIGGSVRGEQPPLDVVVFTASPEEPEEDGPFPKNYEGVKRVSIHVTTSQEQENVRIIWEDTGVGITEQRIRTIEDLGGDGTLRKIKRRLRRVGGDLYVEQRLGGGTRFKIDLIGVDL